MPRHGTWGVRALLWLSAIAPALGSQTPAANAAPSPDTAVMAIVALDRDGRPVADLDPATLTLRIDGAPRPIASLDRVDFDRTPAVSSSGGAPPPFGSNAARAPVPERTFVVIVDDDSIRPGRDGRMRSAVNQFLTLLSPGARVAIATPQGGWRTPLTDDHEVIARALSGIAGRASQQDDPECRTRLALRGVQSLLLSMEAGVIGPTVIVISGGLAGPRRDIPLGSRGLVPGAPPRLGPCDLRIEEFMRVGDAAAGVRASVYVVRPEDVSIDQSMALGPSGAVNLVDGLENLAGAMRGKLLHLTTSERNPLIQALIETAAPYLLTFSPGPSDRDGRSHRVEVQTSRPGIAISAPRTISLAPDSVSVPLTAEDMLRDSHLHAALPLRVTGYISRSGDPARPLQIVAVGEPIDAATLDSATAGLFDPQGRLVAQWTSAAGLPPGRLIAAMAAPPGTYRLRMAAVDTTGRGGSADYFLTAELVPAGSLRLSSIVIGAVGPSGFVPVLQFGPEPVATASLEIYGTRPAAGISAVLEVATTVNGQALLTIPLSVSATGEPDRFTASGEIPLAQLGAGDYVVRVTASGGEGPEGRVLRVLRKAR